MLIEIKTIQNYGSRYKEDQRSAFVADFNKSEINPHRTKRG